MPENGEQRRAMQLMDEGESCQNYQGEPNHAMLRPKPLDFSVSPLLLSCFLENGIDIVQQSVSSDVFVCRYNEIWWKFFPCFREFVEKHFDVFSETALFGFVGFGEDDAERNVFFTEVGYEFQVVVLRGNVSVDEQEKVVQLFSPFNIAGNHAFEICLHDLAALCKAITGQVNEVPLLVDEKMIDEDGLSG